MESFSSIERDTILITGGVGYLGAHITKLFAEKCLDDYNIRVAVRSLAEKKHETMKNSLGESIYEQIDFVQADLTNKDEIFQAVKGVKYIIHVASATPKVQKMTEEYQEQCIIQGTKLYLEAAAYYKIRKFILTSCVSAAVGQVWKEDQDDPVYTEDDFAPTEGVEVEFRCKILQEQILRNFIEEQERSPDDHKMEIVTLLPGVLYGPTLIPYKQSMVVLISKLMKKDIPAIVNMSMPSVDVRDAAEAHYQAFITPNLHGERIIVCKENLSMSKVVSYLDEEFKKYGYKIPQMTVGYLLVKVASWVDSQIKLSLPFIDKEFYADNTKSQDLLELDYSRQFKDTVIEMGYSLIELGIVPDFRRNKNS